MTTYFSIDARDVQKKSDVLLSHIFPSNYNWEVAIWGSPVHVWVLTTIFRRAFSMKEWPANFACSQIVSSVLRVPSKGHFLFCGINLERLAHIIWIYIIICTLFAHCTKRACAHAWSLVKKIRRMVYWISLWKKRHRRLLQSNTEGIIQV